MAIVSVGDLLDRAQEFEDRLAEHYASIRDQSAAGGVRLLTYYLSRHRNHLRQATEDFGSAKIGRVRSIKLKYDIEFQPQAKLHLLEPSPREVTAPELLEAAVEYDLALVSLYKGILEQPLNEVAAAFIESLIRVEERDVVMLKKMMATHYF